MKLQFINKAINYNKILTRTMMKTIKKITAALEESAARNYVTWGAYKRIAPPKKVNPHPGVKGVTEEGKTELHDTDYSGKNHILIGNIESALDKEFVDIYAIASTKPTSYKNVDPTKVSEQTLNKESKDQYFHEKENTVIAKTAVTLDVQATLELQTRPELIQHCNRIKQEKNID